MKYKPYKLPTIVRSKNGDWFVKYFHEYPDRPGIFKEFRVRDNINRIKDLQEKEIEIQALREDIETALERLGYNPFTQEVAVSRQVAFKQAIIAQEEARKKYQPVTLSESIGIYKQWIIEKNLSPRTRTTYHTYLNSLEQWFTENDMTDFPACEFTEVHLAQFLNEFYDEEEWSPRTYNNHLNFFGGYFSRVYKIEKKRNREIKYIIDLDDFEEKIDRAEKNRYYTDSLAIEVKKELTGVLKDFTAWVYLSCMRPKEIKAMKVIDIDISSRQIKVPQGKTGQRLVPISEELYRLILRLGIPGMPKNYYPFGKDGKPGPDKVWRDYFSERYAIVKAKLGLDKNYTLYSWKHTRVVNLINAGFSDREVMELTGHRDVKSFETYKRDLLLNPNSRMTGKTIDF